MQSILESELERMAEEVLGNAGITAFRDKVDYIIAYENQTIAMFFFNGSSV